ncbi:hypothetical protein THTE_1777 [Thermogutta terrifontis]|uniref:Tc1-like transposase DDE domain-containing protein n=1 Tax=Thermogutta terrifontis TaxID=1331910 RepID=A0A286REI9_9BACT|nr:transposase [Thermogutta terrifontis]ASV74379.1 hypothetical protein THTE_1777 [Thermogutta terrifontis]
MAGRYADCERITLICDNLNTHTNGVFYEVFPAERARQYVRRLEFVYTPKHGSWLNVAEVELSVLTRQGFTEPGRFTGGRASALHCLGQSAERQPNRDCLAIHHRGCSHQTGVSLPEN